MPTDIRTKRVYEPAAPDDGARVLVDRIWPRGLTKAQVQADLWLKEAAPSTELRKWTHQDPERYDEFKQRYFEELDAAPEAVQTLLDLAAQGTLTLLFAARDVQQNQAVALREYLLERLQP
jgi:uncharacterized protein YeaO (DUF488 family)